MEATAEKNGPGNDVGRRDVETGAVHRKVVELGRAECGVRMWAEGRGRGTRALTGPVYTIAIALSSRVLCPLHGSFSHVLLNQHMILNTLRRTAAAAAAAVQLPTRPHKLPRTAVVPGQAKVDPV